MLSHQDIHHCVILLGQGWKGNVKARHFVLSLRDYYVEKNETQKHQARANTNDPSNKEPDILGEDEWALIYLDVPYLQPISEAFDDDGSGYVTIAEINQFTDSMPKDLGWRQECFCFVVNFSSNDTICSLQHWIAYWAVGKCKAFFELQSG